MSMRDTVFLNPLGRGETILKWTQKPWFCGNYPKFSKKLYFTATAVNNGTWVSRKRIFNMWWIFNDKFSFKAVICKRWSYKQSKCSSLHMNVGKSLFTFTDCSRIKPLKRKIKVCPITRWFARCSELLSSFLKLISNFQIRFSGNIFADIIITNELALQVCHSIIKTACVLRINISSLVPGWWLLNILLDRIV